MSCTSEWQHVRTPRQAPALIPGTCVLIVSRPGLIPAALGLSCSPCCKVLSLHACLVRTPLTPNSVHPGGLLHHPCCLV